GLPVHIHSRKREYLADASGVELTRNPNGLANALQKIADDEEVLEVANRATAHLYIAQPIKKFSDKKRGLFDTHPPIQERIRILREMAHQAPEPQAAPAAE
ncbi:MAG: M48 family metalloprotease, partial [Actinobacteria bacterium]|nr:M48 family metalloprotease [Actinomycetota bacterium]